MKANGFRGFIYKGILLILLSLYFLLVFSRTNNHAVVLPRVKGQVLLTQLTRYTDTPLPKLLSFEGTSSNKQVKLNWKFETTEGLDECVLERADQSGDFKVVAYFFMTEDIHIPNLRYTDMVPKSQTYLYRLRLTGKNGDKQCTKTLTFNIKNKQDQTMSLNFPSVMQ